MRAKLRSSHNHAAMLSATVCSSVMTRMWGHRCLRLSGRETLVDIAILGTLRPDAIAPGAPAC